jgi:hypothetical protein
MADAELTCPYCNAFVDMPKRSSSARDSRLLCPRCGETFTTPTGAITDQPDASSAAPESITGDTPVSAYFRRSGGGRFVSAESIAGDMPVSPRQKPLGRNRLVGLSLLGFMLLFAGVGLAYALWTSGLRRQHDTGPSQSHRPLPIPTEPGTLNDTGPVAPEKLDALGYLPSDTSLIVGIHLAEIGDSKAGQSLLAQPLPIGPRAVNIDDLLRWTGFKREAIHHLVVGVCIDDPPPLPPRLVLILHSKTRFDADALRKRLKAERQPDVNHHRIDAISSENIPLSFWCADDRRTVVFALVPSALQDVPLQPRDLSKLPRELREALHDRLGTGTPLWAVGTSEDWSKTWAAGLFQNLKPEARGRLNSIHTFAVGIQIGENVTVQGAFDCRDDKHAQALEAYFRKLGKTDNPELKTSVENAWLTLQWRTKLETLLQAMER